MNEPNHALIFIYRLLLRLYPASFQQEFGGEMHTVFIEAAASVAAQDAIGPFFCANCVILNAWVRPSPSLTPRLSQ